MSVYWKVKAARLGSSQSLCCNCREGSPREAPEHRLRKSSGCTEDHTPDALSGAVWRSEIMVWRQKCWRLHFPSLAQTSSLSLVDFGASEAIPRSLKCKCDCFQSPGFESMVLGSFLDLNSFFFFFQREFIASIISAISLSVMTCSLFTSRDSGSKRCKHR